MPLKFPVLVGTYISKNCIVVKVLLGKFWQTGSIWPSVRKVGGEKKVGDLPLFCIPSPAQPPLELIFDILMFSYQKLIFKQSKNGKGNT